MSVFPYEEAERVAQIVEARPGSKVSDIRRYAAVVEESHANLSADKVAYLMSSVSLDEIDAYRARCPHRRMSRETPRRCAP